MERDPLRPLPIIDFQQAARRLLGEDRARLYAISSSPTLAALLPLWIRDRRADGRRPRGVESYEAIFRRFIRFAGDRPVDQVTAELVKDYKRDLMIRVAPGTARHALTVVRMFCEWAVTEGYLVHNPALSIPHPHVETPDPDPLSRSEIGALLTALDAPQHSHKATWGRNRRAVCLMLYAGLRLAEVAGLERRDLDLDRRTLTVRRESGKGGKPRVVPIGDELLRELESIRAYRPPWAVVDQGDTPGKRGRPLAIKSLAHIFERWLVRRGITLHAHQLRKTFATELYLRGEDLTTIQRLLGHNDPKTTMRYIGASAAKEQTAVDRLRFRAEAEDQHV